MDRLTRVSWSSLAGEDGRLRHFLFLSFALLWLAASGGAAVLGVRSYRECRFLKWPNSSSGGLTVIANRGQVLIGVWSEFSVSQPRIWSSDEDVMRSNGFRSVWDRAAVQFGPIGFIPRGSEYALSRGGWVIAPWWVLSVTAMVVSAGHISMYLGEIRKRRRTNLRLCTRCGYDLRASAVRCPECGMAIATAEAKPEGVSAKNVGAVCFRWCAARVLADGLFFLPFLLLATVIVVYLCRESIWPTVRNFDTSSSPIVPDD